MMRTQRWLVAVCCFALMLAFTGVAKAQFPERAITIVCMAEPGATTDNLLRGLQNGMQEYLGQKIIIEYRSGAGGSLAASQVNTSKPDGYTLFAGTGGAIVETPLRTKVPFAPLKLTPISAIASSEHSATVVHPNAPWKTFKELVDYAKANPGRVVMGTSMGTGMHTAMEFVKAQENLDWVYVPYASTVPARTAAMGGHILVSVSGTDWFPLVESGKLRLLVTHGRARSPQSPDVPNLIELGYNFEAGMPQMILGPPGVPADVVAKLEEAIRKGMATPEYEKAMGPLTPLYRDSKDLGNHLRERWTQYEKLYKQFGLIKEAATQPE